MNELALDFQNSSNDHFKLICFLFFFIREDVVTFEDLKDDLMEVPERFREFAFYFRFVCEVSLQLVEIRAY